MAGTPTEENHDPKFRVIDLGAEAKAMMGPKWSAPEVAYVFGKREFVLRTGDAAIYESSPDFGSD